MGSKKAKSNLISAAKPWLSMRYVSLVSLTLQTTIIITLYSYSRLVPKGSVIYLSSTVVVLAEVLKILFCLAIIFKDSGYSLSKCLNTIKCDIFGNMQESVKVLVPASLYALQNNLAFYALNNLDPATFQVAYQLKILSTALFSVLIVNKTIAKKQWLALSLLTLGAALVQVPKNQSGSDTLLSDGGSKNHFLGILSVIACCTSSGFSGVYFEKIIKLNPRQPLWIRNLQLAMWCLLMSTIAMLYQDFTAIKKGGLLQGYSSLVWLLVFLQTFGGLIVAAVVKHADNVLKGFATSTSIILSTIVSHYIFEGFCPSMGFYFGAAMVIASTLMYNYA